MKYHLQSNIPNYYLDVLDNLQKRVCRDIGSKFGVSFDLLPKYDQLSLIFLWTGKTGTSSLFLKDPYWALW